MFENCKLKIIVVYGSMHFHLLFSTVKTAAVYLVPTKSYSKTIHGHLSLKWTILLLVSNKCVIFHHRQIATCNKNLYLKL